MAPKFGGSSRMHLSTVDGSRDIVPEGQLLLLM